MHNHHGLHRKQCPAEGIWAYANLAAAYALLGKMDEANAGRCLIPEFTIDDPRRPNHATGTTDFRA